MVKKEEKKKKSEVEKKIIAPVPVMADKRKQKRSTSINIERPQSAPLAALPISKKKDKSPSVDSLFVLVPAERAESPFTGTIGASASKADSKQKSDSENGDEVTSKSRSFSKFFHPEKKSSKRLIKGESVKVEHVKTDDEEGEEVAADEEGTVVLTPEQRAKLKKKARKADKKRVLATTGITFFLTHPYVFLN